VKAPADDAALLDALAHGGPDRFDLVLEAFRRGVTPETLNARTSIDPWFLHELQELALDPQGAEAGERVFKSVDTCAAEFAARTPYYYSARERPRRAGASSEVERGERRSVVILGAGPNRIGQGIEFDYCCVHAAMTVRETGRDAVMVNCNPETVSTDYDTSDRLYFEPLTLEDVLGVCEVERPDAAQARGGTRGGGGADPRHEHRRDRPRGGPRPLRQAARPARLRGAAVRDGALARG